MDREAPARATPDRRAWEGRFGEALPRLARGTFRLLRPEVRAARLTIPQLHLLGWLERTGPHPSAGWARGAGASPSTVSELVDGLVARGLVRRETDPRDRRRLLLSVTDVGRERLRTVHGRMRRRLAARMATLPTAELARMTRTLERLGDRLLAETGAGGTRGGALAPREAPHAS
ncbi:MAG TPA: MarR family winged helix-turn-helix transcriptional regulator [Thermoplasmata archaeon]|nr:MarR family winged helix-turn-helix transcriptional regulator [Thermoplasmata archaeon]